jgi:hypothetical protein
VEVEVVQAKAADQMQVFRMAWMQHYTPLHLGHLEHVLPTVGHLQEMAVRTVEVDKPTQVEVAVAGLQAME